MRYQQIQKAVFLSRPNRFIAHVEIDGRMETVHVKNTGRCRELLVPGTTVYLEQSDNPDRKTKYDLVTVEKGKLLVNMDSQAPNRLFQEWVQAGNFKADLILFKPETTWGTSRFDFYWEDAHGKKGFVEVKGCTLEEEGYARFPDAPTERGVKHLQELIRVRQEGYEASVCFVLQMEGMKRFCPNDETHPAFGEALRKAAAAGVEILAYECHVIPGQVEMTKPVPVVL